MEIQNTNGKYLIYDDGKFGVNKSNKFLKPSLVKIGYYCYCLQVNNKNTTCNMHRFSCHTLFTKS